MSQTLILVESPAKAKKIQSYLGRGYRAQASLGHICDLPRKEYGIDLDSFEETYELSKRGRDTVKRLRGMARKADRVVLMTDPDREGEAIAWHLARELGLDPNTVERAAFHEVTRPAVQAAVDDPGRIDHDRVDAQRVRRVLDRIVGFDVSKEICWPAGAQSAGRVQTPALHILCEREREIRDFDPETYYTLDVVYEEGFGAFVPETWVLDDGDEEQPDDDGEGSGPGKINRKKFPDRPSAASIREEAARHPHVVQEVDRRRRKRRPKKPYDTAELQKDASRKLKLSAKKTMDFAQTLYENGFITYHRTDSTRVSAEGVEMARRYLSAHHPDVMPDEPPSQRGSSGDQDAHECIRPTQLEDEARLPSGTHDLYELIKARFLASQCLPALFDRTNVSIASGDVAWLAQGSVLVEEGFLVFWRPYARVNETELPDLAEGQRVTPSEYELEEKQTSPPSRYDTGSLIDALKTSGVGRPSTYEPTIEKLLARDYVQTVSGRGEKQFLQPTDFGLQVDALLATAFPDLVSPEYTADMEARLDDMANGQGPGRRAYLKQWYGDFRAAMEDALPRAKAYRDEHGLHASPRGAEETDIECDRCGSATYRKIARKKGKGHFLACPSCDFTRNVQAKTKPEGCPECGSTLVQRHTKSGDTFMGCVRYGMDDEPCDYTEPIDGPRERKFVRRETGRACPKCQDSQLVLLEPTKEEYGTPFWGCGDRCGFTLDKGADVREEPCPECGRPVVQRRRRPTDEQKKRGERGDPFWSCAGYPDCRFAADYEPQGAA